MNFPTAPVNGQTTTVNNITYVYSSANRSWTRSAGVTGTANVTTLHASTITTSKGVFNANGVAYSPSYTASSTPPSTPKVSDQWYNPTADILYEYVTDGVSSYWIDFSSTGAGYSATTTNIVTSITPYINNQLSIGTSALTFANLYVGAIFSNSINSPTIGNTGAAITGAAATLSSTVNATGLNTGALNLSQGGASIYQDLWVGGNIYANALNTVTTSILSIQDPLLYLSSSNVYPYNYNLGFYGHFVGGAANVYAHTGLVRNPNDNAWYLFSNVPEPSGNTINLASANTVLDTLKLGNVSMTGGNVAAAGNLTLGTAGTTAITINTSQNVGVGSSPISFGAGYTSIAVSNTTGGGVAFATAGVQKGAIFNGGNAMYIDCSNSAGALNIRNTATGATSIFDANGNFGLGTTPSAWSLSTGGHALEFSNAGSMWNYSNTTGIILSQNVYYNGAYYYKSTAAATLYGQGSGSHIWYNAPSGIGGTTFTPTQAMTLDNSGNLGLGVTPSAWATIKAIEVVGGGGTANAVFAGGYGATYANNNCYFNGTNWIYKASSQSSQYNQVSGIHSWLTSASGTAGNAITYTQAMTLDAGGNLSTAGTITPTPAYSNSAALNINGLSANTFYTIIPPGTLSQGYYLVNMQWNHGGSGGPYIVSTSFPFWCAYTNNVGTDTAFQPMSVTHTGSGAYFQVRGISSTASTNGIQVSFTWAGNGYISIYCIKYG